MNERIDLGKDDEEPFAWMKPYMSGPADLSAQLAPKAQYAPRSRDPELAKAQDEEMLAHEIWVLALKEAYATNKAGWFQQMQGREKHEIVADYYRRHPAMERFVKRHTEAGTCSQAMQTLQDEAARRKAGYDADVDLTTSLTGKVNSGRVSETQDVAPPGQKEIDKPQFDFGQAKWLLKTMKSTKEITERPSRLVVQGILECPASAPVRQI
jgi:hypothetical protein